MERHKLWNDRAEKLMKKTFESWSKGKKKKVYEDEEWGYDEEGNSLNPDDNEGNENPSQEVYTMVDKLKMHVGIVDMDEDAREYISDTTMDPAKLTSTDKFGVAPQNTTLSIVYRTNTTDRVNAGANTLNRVASPIVDFNDAMNLQTSIKDYVINSIEVNNEEPIVGDVSIPTTSSISFLVFSKSDAGRSILFKIGITS